MSEASQVWLIFVCVITCSAFVQSSLGFGFAMVAMAVLPYFFEIRQANIIISLSCLAPMLMACWFYRRDLDLSILLFALLGALVGLPAGLLVFKYANSSWLVRGTGFVILLIVIHSLLHRRNSNATAKIASLWSGLAGIASGFLAGSVAVSGPPIVLYATHQPWPPHRIRAFVLGFLTIQASIKALSLAVLGLIDQSILIFTIVAVPFGFLGAQLGARVVEYIDAERFRLIALIFLGLIAMGMIIRTPENPEKKPIIKSEIETTSRLDSLEAPFQHQDFLYF